MNRSVLLRGVFGICGTVLYFYTLTIMPLATAMTLNYLSPMSVLMGYFVFKESLTFTKSIGLCFIVGALMLNEFFSLRDKKLKAKMAVSRPESLSYK